MSSSNHSRITVDHLWKRYRRPHQRAATLKQAFLAFLRGQTGYDEFWAVKDISFTVGEGEAVGVIGPNGSGKSTLLGLIARVLRPTKGETHVEGRVCPLLELGTGFHPELTGRENVYLNASLLGLRGKQVRKRYDEIVAFSELADFMDAPVRTYSSGMYLRLAFSVAVHVDPDVLLIDEVLAVGDQRFHSKCIDKINSFREEGKAILLVTHDLPAVRQLCQRTIWMHQAEKLLEGPTEEVLDAYLKWANEQGWS